MTITDEEARQYYDAHPSEFTEPATVTLREILDRGADRRRRRASTSAPTSEAKTQGRDDPRAALLAGEDFAKVAAEVSDVAVEGERRPDRAVDSHDDLSPELQAADRAR